MSASPATNPAPNAEQASAEKPKRKASVVIKLYDVDGGVEAKFKFDPEIPSGAAGDGLGDYLEEITAAQLLAIGIQDSLPRLSVKIGELRQICKLFSSVRKDLAELAEEQG